MLSVGHNKRRKADSVRLDSGWRHLATLPLLPHTCRFQIGVFGHAILVAWLMSIFERSCPIPAPQWRHAAKMNMQAKYTKPSIPSTPCIGAVSMPEGICLVGCIKFRCSIRRTLHGVDPAATWKLVVWRPWQAMAGTMGHRESTELEKYI